MVDKKELNITVFPLFTDYYGGFMVVLRILQMRDFSEVVRNGWPFFIYKCVISTNA